MGTACGYLKSLVRSAGFGNQGYTSQDDTQSKGCLIAGEGLGVDPIMTYLLKYMYAASTNRTIVITHRDEPLISVFLAMSQY